MMIPDATAQSTARLITTSNPNGSINSGEVLEMDVGRSAAIRTDWAIARVSVANPEVADVQVLDPGEVSTSALNEVLIVSNAVGKTDLILWGTNGELWVCEIHVDIDPEDLNKDLNALFPHCKISISRSEDVYFIQGIMQRSDQVENMHKFLEVSGINFVDMTNLAGLHQVKIHVRVAEVNRKAIKRMTINALYGSSDFVGASMTGSASGGSLNPFSIAHAAGIPFAEGIKVPFIADASNSPVTTLFAGFPRADLAFFIQALEENQYLQLLAEPTLVAMSGEEAKFLAGGEFPIPVANNSSGDNNTITIEFKEVGVRLAFRPEVLGDGTIRIHVDTEISEISDFGAIEAQGFNIPSIITRRVDTTLEMKSGQTFTMAGLLNHTTNVKNSKVPMLGDLPVIGTLFRSVSYQLGESELVILVTPSLVEPVSYNELPPLPGSEYVPPTDWELMGLGQIFHMEDSDNPDPDALTELKGPGAWDSHREEEKPAK